MKRRSFIQKSSLAAFSVSAFGSIYVDGKLIRRIIIVGILITLPNLHKRVGQWAYPILPEDCTHQIHDDSFGRSDRYQYVYPLKVDLSHKVLLVG